MFTTCRTLSDSVLDVHYRRNIEGVRRSRLKSCPGSSPSALQLVSAIHTATLFRIVQNTIVVSTCKLESLNPVDE